MSFADVSSRSRTVNHTGEPTRARVNTRHEGGASVCTRVYVCVHGSTGWPLPYVIRADAKQRFEIAVRDPGCFDRLWQLAGPRLMRCIPHRSRTTRDPAITVIAISALTGDFAYVRYLARPRSFVAPRYDDITSHTIFVALHGCSLSGARREVNTSEIPKHESRITNRYCAYVCVCYMGEFFVFKGNKL